MVKDSVSGAGNLDKIDEHVTNTEKYCQALTEKHK